MRIPFLHHDVIKRGPRRRSRGLFCYDIGEHSPARTGNENPWLLPGEKAMLKPIYPALINFAKKWTILIIESSIPHCPLATGRIMFPGGAL
jgi:hypothetical protein